MSTKMKYLKNENGDIFSPITSSSSVMMGGVSLEEYSNNKIKLLWDGTDTSTNDSWRDIIIQESYNDYDIIIAGIGVSYTEMTTVIMPSLKNTNNKAYNVCWRCQALDSGYYSGGQIGLSSTNTKKVQWRTRYFNGWTNSSLFFIIGIKS